MKISVHVRRMAPKLAAFVFACVSAPTHAQSDPETFEMIVISDQAFGLAVIEGDHHTAIYNITTVKKNRFDRFARSNNLCVAYVRAEQPDKAAAECDKAVKASRWLPDRERAVALSNRGVLLAITGDHEGALHDLEAAARGRSRLATPRANLALLTARRDQVAAASP